MIKLREINDRYFKSTNDGVFLKRPTRAVDTKRNGKYGRIRWEVQPLLQKQVEIEL